MISCHVVANSLVTHAVAALKNPSVKNKRIVCTSTLGLPTNAIVKCTTVCATLRTAQTRNTLLMIHLTVFLAARRPPRGFLCSRPDPVRPISKGERLASSVSGVKDEVTGGRGLLCQKNKDRKRRFLGKAGVKDVWMSCPDEAFC